MKTVFYFNISCLPIANIYDTYNRLSKIVGLKAERFDVVLDCMAKGKERGSKSGLLGKKGIEYLSSVKFSDMSKTLGFLLIGNKAKKSDIENGIMTDVNSFIFNVFLENIFIALIVDKISEKKEKITDLITAVEDDMILFSYCFDIDSIKMPSYLLSGTFVLRRDTDDLKSRRTKAEDNFTMSTGNNKMRKADQRLPYMLPIMYVKPKDEKTLVEICRRLNYKTEKCKTGIIIDTSKTGNYEVQLMDENNELFRFLEKEGILYYGKDKDDTFLQY
jgi:hypothetical protein